MALALRTTVLEGRVHHVGRRAHPVRHPLHEVRVSRSEERHRQYAREDWQAHARAESHRYQTVGTSDGSWPRGAAGLAAVVAAQHVGEQLLVPGARMLKACVAPRLDEFDCAATNEDEPNIERAAKGILALEPVVIIAVGGIEVV